ncbi:hypothetical protein HEP86_34960 [Streptomyces sp. RPA4-5]|uniref:hypothetical protein n=1 Tax=Streptomyces TaxID=1883 RepID=UPI00143E4773|nr:MULTISPECIES: hypothetical protein [Streptomyces]MCX4635629.1 hypothetical protein [Streptomyces platensis]QIY58733.1 hypothetical protein HEP86_34960 [Streptomyces sp. RPA4-5]WJY42000.1 hypothetical protein QT196_34745 [Streptomyces sp. P9-2B-2]
MPIITLLPPLTCSPAAWAVVTLLCIWTTAYVVIVSVALLHPRRSRRKEARKILDRRLLVPRAL